MNQDVHKITNCRICNAQEFTSVLTIGSLTLTGVFPKIDEEDPLREELHLIKCNSCHFLQLDRSINPDLMYKAYWYRSGTNQTMRDHLSSVVKNVTSLVKLNDEDYCIDIGCNDGTLLKSYRKQGVKCNLLGYDPSNAIEEIKDDSIVAINNYFNAPAFQEKFPNKKAKIITSISMFYDLDNPHKFIEDIKACLAEDGMWVVEVNYTMKMLSHLGFDMISHEHVSYYTFHTLDKLMRMNGVYINDVSFNEINGGNVCLYVGFKDTPSERVKEAMKIEKDFGIEESKVYETFANRVKKFKLVLSDYLQSIAKQGHKIGAYGASTRGNTLLQYCNIDKNTIFAAADRNPDKIGLRTSGSAVPIISEQEMREINPPYLFSLPYYFTEEFIKREEEYLKKGGIMIFALPYLKEVSWDAAANKVVEKIINKYDE